MSASALENSGDQNSASYGQASTQIRNACTARSRIAAHTHVHQRTLRRRLETRMRTTKVCELGFGTKGPLALPNLVVVVDQEQPQALPPQRSLELP
jgi:hypothetical protein